MFRSITQHAVRTVALAATLFVSANTAAGEMQSCPAFTDKQVEVLKQSYALGQPHDLGYTLAAIAYKESAGGIYLINAMTSDYGVYQGNVRTVCSQAGVYHNDFQCNMEIQSVVTDIEHAAKHAIETLSYWRDYHQKRAESYLVYENMIRSYNGGFNFEIDQVTDYWEDFRLIYHTVKNCVDLASA